MDWQQATALAIVAVTAGLFLAARLRRRTFSLQKDTACGCGSGPALGGKQTLCFSARKGERPKVLVKNV